MKTILTWAHIPAMATLLFSYVLDTISIDGLRQQGALVDTEDVSKTHKSRGQ
jgi:hypothetical protein